MVRRPFQVSLDPGKPISFIEKSGHFSIRFRKKIEQIAVIIRVQGHLIITLSPNYLRKSKQFTVKKDIN